MLSLRQRALEEAKARAFERLRESKEFLHLEKLRESKEFLQFVKNQKKAENNLEFWNERKL